MKKVKDKKRTMKKMNTKKNSYLKTEANYGKKSGGKMGELKKVRWLKWQKKIRGKTDQLNKWDGK